MEGLRVAAAAASATSTLEENEDSSAPVTRHLPPRAARSPLTPIAFLDSLLARDDKFPSSRSFTRSHSSLSPVPPFPSGVAVMVPPRPTGLYGEEEEDRDGGGFALESGGFMETFESSVPPVPFFASGVAVIMPPRPTFSCTSAKNWFLVAVVASAGSSAS
ncbi:hypothetical protein MMC17_008755 [Xylographa soralifera]|nr:hypothetical protein [Xylographa soralifera]